MKPERGLQGSLGRGLPGGEAEHHGAGREISEPDGHAGILRERRPVRKAGYVRRGFVMVEAMMGLSLLTVLGMVLLKLSLNILHPRQWILQQAVSDAYMTYERAYAERIPFENLVAGDSPWPAYPQKTTTTVELGRLPGGAVIAGTVIRTRIPDTGNYPIDGGSGTVVTNPAAMKVWKAQSVVTYKVGSRNYVKSRTVLRSQ